MQPYYYNTASRVEEHMTPNRYIPVDLHTAAFNPANHGPAVIQNGCVCQNFFLLSCDGVMKLKAFISSLHLFHHTDILRMCILL